MSANGDADARRATDRDLAADHEARGTKDELHGAIHGKHSPEQMNSWEIAKIDLSSEQRIEREMIAEQADPRRIE